MLSVNPYAILEANHGNMCSCVCFTLTSDVKICQPKSKKKNRCISCYETTGQKCSAMPMENITTNTPVPISSSPFVKRIESAPVRARAPALGTPPLDPRRPASPTSAAAGPCRSALPGRLPRSQAPRRGVRGPQSRLSWEGMVLSRVQCNVYRKLTNRQSRRGQG